MNRERVQEISEQSKQERWPFPRTFEALKAAGVASYRFDVRTCETVFQGLQGPPLAEPLGGASPVAIAPSLDAVAVGNAIKRHILDRTAFLDFRGEAASAGVEYWEVDMGARTCTYVGPDGERHVERVP